MFDDGSWVAWLPLLVPFLWLSVPLSLVYVALRFLRAYERRGAAAAESGDVAARLARLEEAVAQLAADHGRLAEAQRFTDALLAGRTSAPAAADSAVSDLTPAVRRAAAP